jgi:predicted small secreted protein
MKLDWAFGYTIVSIWIFQEDVMIKRIVLANLCVAILAGCNTVKGVGKDIESGGKAIERSSGK